MKRMIKHTKLLKPEYRGSPSVKPSQNAVDADPDVSE
jgi:hypothetical protein